MEPTDKEQRPGYVEIGRVKAEYVPLGNSPAHLVEDFKAAFTAYGKPNIGQNGGPVVEIFTSHAVLNDGGEWTTWGVE